MTLCFLLEGLYKIIIKINIAKKSEKYWLDYLIIIKNQVKKERIAYTAIVNYYGLLDESDEEPEEQEREEQEPVQEHEEIQYD